VRFPLQQSISVCRSDDKHQFEAEKAGGISEICAGVFLCETTENAGMSKQELT